MQVRRRKDPTAEQEGYITVLWFPRCCARHEKAEKADKWMKYTSSIGVSFALFVLCCYGVRYKVHPPPPPVSLLPLGSVCHSTGKTCSETYLTIAVIRQGNAGSMTAVLWRTPGQTRKGVAPTAQAEVGEVVLGALLLADFLIGVYVVVLDELVKEWRLVRTKPYQMELDDALALTDEDALAKDMSALRAGKAEGRSYYMEVMCLSTSLCAQQTSQDTRERSRASSPNQQSRLI